MILLLSPSIACLSEALAAPSKITPEPMIPNQLADEVVALAKGAGKIILQIYCRNDFAVTEKSQSSMSSPLTEADLAAHGFIVEGLKQLSSLPVLSEEADLPSYQERQNWTSFWMVDPLDGTKEFINRNGEFTVNLALIENCRPVLGVVHVPALDVTYYTMPGQGALKQKGNQSPAPISVTALSRRSVRVVASRSHPSPKMEQFLSRLEKFEIVETGSSLKFCRVAEGAADLYPRLGPTMEWDTAAGHCIVETAGGSVSTLDGMPLVYNKEDLRNPDFVVSSQGAEQWNPYTASAGQVVCQS